MRTHNKMSRLQENTTAKVWHESSIEKTVTSQGVSLDAVERSSHLFPSQTVCTQHSACLLSINISSLICAAAAVFYLSHTLSFYAVIPSVCHVFCLSSALSWAAGYISLVFTFPRKLVPLISSAVPIYCLTSPSSCASKATTSFSHLWSQTNVSLFFFSTVDASHLSGSQQCRILMKALRNSMLNVV